MPLQAPTSKYGINIVSVQPSSNTFTGVLKTGGKANGQIVSMPMAFRWPQVGENWMARFENGTWWLEGIMVAGTPPTYQNAAPGDLILNSPTGVVHVLGNADSTTDFTFSAQKVPALVGSATLVSGTAVVHTTAITGGSLIFLTAQDNNTTGSLRVSSRVAGTSFTITSTNGADHGVVAYQMFTAS